MRFYVSCGDNLVSFGTQCANKARIILPYCQRIKCCHLSDAVKARAPANQR